MNSDINWDKLSPTRYDCYVGGVLKFALSQNGRGRWVISDPRIVSDARNVVQCWDLESAFRWVEDNEEAMERIRSISRP